MTAFFGEETMLQKLRLSFATFCGRLIQRLLLLTNHQASTLPGKVMLRLYPGILRAVTKNKKTILVTGTNGKTTTVSLIVRILRENGFKVVTNASGANLLQGLTTVVALADSRADYFVLEVDEAALATAAPQLHPDTVLVTNLFRDQLDRYGELRNVFQFIYQGIEAAKPRALVLCGDDPLVASLGNASPSSATYYFGLYDDEHHQKFWQDKDELAVDLSISHCPVCGHILDYDWFGLSHLGKYHCSQCSFDHPGLDYHFSEKIVLEKSYLTISHGRIDPITSLPTLWHEASVEFPLQGRYNAYNACAAIAGATTLLSNDEELKKQKGLSFSYLVRSLATAKPSFGRQEKITLPNGRKICFLLIKNPAGMEQTLSLFRHFTDVRAILFAINSFPADSCDVSWLWDVPLHPQTLPQVPYYVTGIRRGDMALRLRYSGIDLPFEHVVDMDAATLDKVLFSDDTETQDCIYIVANYTAMLSLRQSFAAFYGFDAKWSKEEE